jgi:fructose-1,6-bisphosphatase I
MTLSDHLSQTNCPDDLRDVILSLCGAAKDIKDAFATTDTGKADSANQFGEEQLKMDVLSDQLIHKHLTESGLINGFISEEQPDVVDVNPDGEFAVVFDPLDGSSLFDVSFAVGTILGVYKCPAKDIIGKTPREQVAALYFIYGPRTVLVCSTGNGVHEYEIRSSDSKIDTDHSDFRIAAMRENIQISPDATTYSPGNLRAVTDTPEYRNLLNVWLDEAMTLRYSGCMASDVHHIFAKEQGVFTNIGGNKYPQGKLRLVFECGPFAYLAEQAGGSCSTGSEPVLDLTITEIDQRTPIIIGSKNEVERCCEVLSSQKRLF